MLVFDGNLGGESMPAMVSETGPTTERERVCVMLTSVLRSARIGFSLDGDSSDRGYLDTE